MIGLHRDRGGRMGGVQGSSTVRPRALLGTVIHSIRLGEIEIIQKAAIVFDAQGVIQQVVDLEAKPELLETLQSECDISDYSGKLIIPGFVDAHCHAPQYVFAGTGMDLPLLEWLRRYTFPCEARFADLQFARMAYEKSIKRHLKCGTTFASYFATIHYDACKVLVEVINEVGQRAHVGKVNMDRNCPDYYIEDTHQGCDETENFIQYVLSLTPVGKEYLTKRICNYATQSVGGGDGDGPPRWQLLQKTPTFIESKTSSSSSSSSTSSQAAPALLHPGPNRRRTWSEWNAAMIHRVEASDEGLGCTVERFIEGDTLLDKVYTPLVMPCVTPRFVPTCTADMMHRLGALSLKYGLPVQSHLSESVNEIRWVAELHPDCATYATVYEKHGLLHDAVYMAHCCHSPPEERAILARTGASVIHCASSNFMLNSGVMDVRQFLDEGIKVALGTDVAGGYSPSMLDAIRQTVVASRVKGFDSGGTSPPPPPPLPPLPPLPPSHADGAVGDGNGDVLGNGDDDDGDAASPATSPAAETPSPMPRTAYRCLSYLEAFHLATVGGAEVLGMGDVLGNFRVGKKADCLVVDVAVADSPIDVFEHETAFEQFQKFLFLGDDRNILHVYVDGRKVI